MRTLLIAAVCTASATLLVRVSGQQPAAAAPPALVVLDNTRVRVYKTIGPSLAGVEHRPGVVVPIDATTRTVADAYWLPDAAAANEALGAVSLIVVQPKDVPATAPVPRSRSRPGEAVFTGMSFKTVFENEQVTVIRARMEVGAREGEHTHGSDTLVVHLSGGEIEDTANGTTTVNRWTPGDVEFEARGSSHSARNVGAAIDVVLVALKP
jgi:quercetin dioxygenase-like cupin family protein